VENLSSSPIPLDYVIPCQMNAIQKYGLQDRIDIMQIDVGWYDLKKNDKKNILKGSRFLFRYT